MAGKIIGFLREYILVISAIMMIVGLILFLMGAIWYWFRDVQLGFYTDTINNLGDWNAYILVLGLVDLGFGLYYIYSFFKKRKFVLEEIETNKRSELLKKHNELEETVRHLPSKYKKMLKEKEEELRIK